VLAGRCRFRRWCRALGRWASPLLVLRPEAVKRSLGGDGMHEVAGLGPLLSFAGGETKNPPAWDRRGGFDCQCDQTPRGALATTMAETTTTEAWTLLEAIALAERFMLRGRERQRRARLSRRDRVIATLHSRACLNATAYDENQAFQMLTDGRMKYIWRPHSGAEQLFDLTTDPKEYINLAAEPDRAASEPSGRLCFKGETRRRSAVSGFGASTLRRTKCDVQMGDFPVRTSNAVKALVVTGCCAIQKVCGWAWGMATLANAVC
jgi:hypothetical protein